MVTQRCHRNGRCQQAPLRSQKNRERTEQMVENYSLLDMRALPPVMITLNNSVYWQEFEDPCVYECLDGKDCQSFFCCYEECKSGSWRRGRIHIDVSELDSYSCVFFPTSFLLFNLVY
ncbi:gamma-aminobutyric acid receptor subunit gamma-3-like [Mesocricetus auratus]|uniref:Gamma-aminobutyric acid receptor subunit gamma-3-like n=1 Tax=Mesocricetus auratus TaxID=10036 RepID=A0ABM2X1S7_MESAU|nr:gamma-aminobutyric acid receptor subunit gamma-3-like [Mesocricetus auratus]